MNGYLSVIEILRASGPVGLLIGGSGIATARVYPGDPPPTVVYPLISVETFDAEAFDSKSGPASTDHDLVKVFCEANTDVAAMRLATACRTALEGLEGTYNGKYVENIRWLRTDSYDVQLTNTRVRIHEQDYQVRVRV